MKLTDTILLLRNGYTKAEITAMNTESETEDTATLKARITELEDTLKKAQSENVKNDTTENPNNEKPVLLNDI